MTCSKYRGRYQVPLEDVKDVDMLMGKVCHKGVLSVEDNLVNAIVLGDQILGVQPTKIEDAAMTEALKPFQVVDVGKMISRPNILNANPMGLGKTIETICALKLLQVPSALIICPKIVCEQWRCQLKKWWPDSPKVRVLTSTRGCADIKDDGTIWIMNYEKLINREVLTRVRSFRWPVVILDEAHRIKNRTSARTIACKQVPAARHWALTGTPILRYVDDLWSLLEFLNPFFSGASYWSFVNYFCEVVEDFWGKKIVGITPNEDHKVILNKALSKFCIRNDAVEVAHGKVIETVKLQMTPSQRKLYKSAVQLVLEELPPEMTIANGAVLTIRLRQITSWPGLFASEHPDKAFGPKFEYVLNKAQDNSSEQIVVFTAFEQSAEALSKYLSSNGVTSATITGQHDAEQNELNKQRFISREVQVLIGTIGAMGQGYDGLQEVSRYMVMMERDWSPEINAQCEDRLKRMGQQYPVSIEYLECTGTFDAKVGRINMKKASDIREALTMEDDE